MDVGRLRVSGDADGESYCQGALASLESLPQLMKNKRLRRNNAESNPSPGTGHCREADC